MVPSHSTDNIGHLDTLPHDRLPDLPDGLVAKVPGVPAWVTQQYTAFEHIPEIAYQTVDVVQVTHSGHVVLATNIPERVWPGHSLAGREVLLQPAALLPDTEPAASSEPETRQTTLSEVLQV